jgi:hypothetical protein
MNTNAGSEAVSSNTAGVAGAALTAGATAGASARPPEPQDPPVPPENAPPHDLWHLPEAATPPNPRYVVLVSAAGDPVANGKTHTYTQANATLNLELFLGRVQIDISGEESWHGIFDTNSHMVAPASGYFPFSAVSTEAPIQTLDRPALLWSSPVTQPCAAVSGWFAIDDIAFNGNLLSTLDLRFEQHCDSAADALRGQLHWSAFDPTIPPGPTAAPVGLWSGRPEPATATGNYVYLESDPADVIGAGQSATYPFEASALGDNGPLVSLVLDGWAGHFIAMRGHNQLELGYYGDLERWPAYDPVKGGLAWSSSERFCDTLKGWFVVDAVRYADATLTALDLRFEQHCNEAAAALHGRIHFVK